MDERAPLNINATKPAGTRVKGRADLGGNGSNEKGVGMAKNGVHPASCNCFGCFKAKEAAKEAAKRAKQGANKRGGRIPGRRTSQLDQGCGKRVGDGQANFTTVGERLSRLGSAEDLARFARTVEATRTAKSHLLNDRSSRSHCLVKVHLKRGSARSSLLFVDLAGNPWDPLQLYACQHVRLFFEQFSRAISRANVLRRLGANQEDGRAGRG